MATPSRPGGGRMLFMLLRVYRPAVGASGPRRSRGCSTVSDGIRQQGPQSGIRTAHLHGDLGSFLELFMSSSMLTLLEANHHCQHLRMQSKCEAVESPCSSRLGAFEMKSTNNAAGPVPGQTPRSWPQVFQFYVRARACQMALPTQWVAWRGKPVPQRICIGVTGQTQA